MLRVSIPRIPVVVGLLAVVAGCLLSGPSFALTLLPGESALWRFEDPGPLSPMYDWVGFTLDQIDLGPSTPTGAHIGAYDDVPAGQAADTEVTFLNFTGLRTFGVQWGGPAGALFDDPVFHILLTNVGDFSFSFSEIQSGSFTKGAETDFVRAATIPITPVPEPGTWALFGVGLVGLVGAVRRRIRT